MTKPPSFSQMECLICQEHALDPDDLSDSNKDLCDTWVNVHYCDHFFHWHCLTEYLKGYCNGVGDCPACRSFIRRQRSTIFTINDPDAPRGYDDDDNAEVMDWQLFEPARIALYSDEEQEVTIRQQLEGTSANHFLLPRGLCRDMSLNELRWRIQNRRDLQHPYPGAGSCAEDAEVVD